MLNESYYYLVGMSAKYIPQSNEWDYRSIKLSSDMSYEECKTKITDINKILLKDKAQYNDDEPSILYLDGGPILVIHIVAKKYLPDDTSEEHMLDENYKKVKLHVFKRYMFNKMINKYVDITILDTVEEMKGAYEAWSTGTIH